MEISKIRKKGGRVSWKPRRKNLGSPVTHYAVEKWESSRSTWMPVKRVPSNKTSCDLSHVTEGQKIFLRILVGNVAGQSKPQNKEYLQNDQQAIRDSSVIFVAPYWPYRISCLEVQLAPLAQGADSDKWNIGLDICKKRRRMEIIFEFVYTFHDV